MDCIDYTNALSRAQANQSFALKLRNSKYKGLYAKWKYCIARAQVAHFQL